jgi:DnaJ family protein B protein 4
MSVKSDDLYKRLELDKSASEDDIKKAYKKAALKWHPDRNTHQKELATENFKKISEAYEILSDQNKRRIYDQYGMKGFEGPNMEHEGGMSNHFNFGGAPNHFNMGGNNFRQFNMHFGPGFKMGGKMGGKMGDNMGSNHFSDPSDIFNMFFANNMGMFDEGDTQFFKTHTRSNFKQKAYKTATNNKDCEQSEIEHKLNIDLEVLYSGGIKKLKISNNGHEKIFEIEIKPGWKEGTKVKFEDKNIGNVTFVIMQKKHQKFTRQDGDLIYHHKLDGQIEKKELLLETLSGKKLKINLENKKKGEQITVSNEGMPIRKNGEQVGFGDLIIKII